MSQGEKQTLQGKYDKFVIKSVEGCWGWSGCLSEGYGQFRFSTRRERSHRASWRIHFGDIPAGMCVLHKCDNRICSRPDHLFLGTRTDNIRDMDKKGRRMTYVNGESHYLSKLTNDQVRQVKYLLDLGETTKSISNKLAIKSHTISAIKQNKIWKGIH